AGGRSMRNGCLTQQFSDPLQVFVLIIEFIVLDQFAWIPISVEAFMHSCLKMLLIPFVPERWR
ncbi:MAG: hypothetical protein QW238_03405, partial [Candidatus Bathyarchaeia archaeon]